MANIITRVDIDRPVSQVYERWSRLEDMPRLFASVLQVEQVDANRVAWTARIAGESRQWVAEVTEQVPEHRIAWRTVEGTAHEGVVTFHRLAGEATRVVVQIDWKPQGTFEKVGDVLGIVSRRIDRELDRFRTDLQAVARTPREAPAPLPVRGTGGEGRGRGRRADSPTEIPATGWKDVLARTMAEAKDDHVPVLAAGVAFYLMLSLFPALVAVLSIYGLVVEPSQVGEMLGPVLAPLPTGIEDLITEQLTNLTTTSETGLGVGLVVSLLAAIWSASKGMKSLIEAINAAFDERETRKFIPPRGLALLLTVGAVVVIVATVALLTVVPGLAESFGNGGRLVASILRWPLLALVMVGSLAVLYRVAPNRDDARWRWVTPGAVVATVAWMVGSALFAVYADNFGKFNETYGSLGAVVVLLLWLNLTAYVVLFGAELNAESERQTKNDTTRGRPERMGQRDAYAADTVGETAEQVKLSKSEKRPASV